MRQLNDVISEAVLLGTFENLDYALAKADIALENGWDWEVWLPELSVESPEYLAAMKERMYGRMVLLMPGTADIYPETVAIMHEVAGRYEQEIKDAGEVLSSTRIVMGEISNDANQGES
jgi:hypothetical protein